jgi:basic amino acid/polyamine antiporter, APA family
LEEKAELRRVVGVFGLSTNIINMIVGAGIFVLPAIVATGLGASSVFAYLFCGFLVALVMLCFAEAGSRLTTSGGAYLFINTAFGPYFGFLTAILFVLATISSNAAVANAIVSILGSIFPVFKFEIARILVFILFFSGLGYINIRGVKNGLKVVELVTVIKLIPLLLLVAFSWGEVSIVQLQIESMPSFNKIAKISLVLFFAFQGAESGLSIGGEVINPRKTIPKAIFMSILVVLVLYILVQTVAQGVLGNDLPSFKGNPLGAVASQVFGPVGFTIMSVAAAISMSGYLSSSILSMPRILYQSSKDKVLPVPVLTKIHSRFQTPYVAIITYVSLGFLFATFGGFEALAIIASATVLLIYLGVSLSVIKLRKLNLDTQSAFIIPGGILVPILSCLTIIFLLTNLAAKEFAVILLTIVFLSVLYFMKNRKP